MVNLRPQPAPAVPPDSPNRYLPVLAGCRALLDRSNPAGRRSGRSPGYVRPGIRTGRTDQGAGTRYPYRHATADSQPVGRAKRILDCRPGQQSDARLPLDHPPCAAGNPSWHRRSAVGAPCRRPDRRRSGRVQAGCQPQQVIPQGITRVEHAGGERT